MGWKKGQSGNPNGRPNHERIAFVAKLKKDKMVDKAVKVLKEGLEGKERIDCAKYILDQVIGKPPQTITADLGGQEDNPIKISINIDKAQKDELVRYLRTKITGKG